MLTSPRQSVASWSAGLTLRAGQVDVVTGMIVTVVGTWMLVCLERRTQRIMMSCWQCWSWDWVWALHGPVYADCTERPAAKDWSGDLDAGPPPFYRWNFNRPLQPCKVRSQTYLPAFKSALSEGLSKQPLLPAVKQSIQAVPEDFQHPQILLSSRMLWEADEVSMAAAIGVSTWPSMSLLRQ